MNSKAIRLIKNFSYTLSSNLISMLISILVVLIVPKLIGVQEYGYWQLFLFYSSYVGFLHFGWNDGIYLRYGGKKYEELNKELFFSQFYMLGILQLIIAIIIYFASILFLTEENKIFIFQMIALCLLTSNLRTMLLFIMQSTNRIKKYAQITIMDRILYCCLIIVFLLVGVREYKLMIFADLISKLCSLVYAMYCCRDIVFRRISTFYFNFKETLENISVGIKLMFSNIASMLIIGVVRFGIERSWNVSTFGKVSLTLSVSSLMMLFINAVGIIIFPILRRTDERKLPSIYITLRDFLMVILLGALIAYYPIKVVLSAWLPKYADSLMYMALVFPMCVFEGKMILLINTYLKTLRKEKLMLTINLISLVLSVIITFVTTILFKNLNLAIASIVVILAFRCALAEMRLSEILKISLYKDMILELIMTLIFVLSGWYINSWIAPFLYALAYIMYLFIKRKDMTKTISNLKQLMIA
jgi:O-antigen/teichoic acid export membrane protein